MIEPDSSVSAKSEGEPTAARLEMTADEISKQLDRLFNIYGICLRDYFSTFAAYTTATTILVAALGFLARDNPRDNKSSPLILLVAICGLILCWQWYISTASMRDQVGHFKTRIREWEKEARVSLLSRWLLAAELARGYKFEDLSEQTKEDRSRLNPTFKFLDNPLGLRGAMLPVIYAAIFLGVAISFSPFPQLARFAFALALLWLLLVPTTIHYFRIKRIEKRIGKRMRRRIWILSLLLLLLALLVVIWIGSQLVRH